MIGPGVGQVAFRWAAFIVVASGLMLLVVRPGTPEFVITVVMLVVGLAFGAGVFALVRLPARGHDRSRRREI